MELAELARVGPWPSLSKPIGYDGRLWFVNGTLRVNHNSADVYSYEPSTGVLRYERHLFSQDAGDPLVAAGLLYWPSEDSRFSVGWGDLAVTDGTRWAFHIVPTAQIFHIHALAEFQDRLIAASSAWRAGLQASSDGGATWAQIYDHPTPEGRVSRIVGLAATSNLLFAHIIERGESRLLQYDGVEVRDVPSWPAGRAIRALTSGGDRAYGLVDEADGVAVWSSDGESSQRLAPPWPGWRARDIASNEHGLWAITRENVGGAVWQSAAGRTWEKVAEFSGGVPEDIWLQDRDLYVLGTGDDGRGILWGPQAPRVLPTESHETPRLPRRPPVNWVRAPDWNAEANRLSRLIGDHEAFNGRAVLRDRVWQNVATDAPAFVYDAALAADAPDLSFPLIGGNTSAVAGALRDWIILWGMAAAERGRVPIEFLSRRFTAPPNRAEKYFDLAPAALWAAAQIGQADRCTIEAVIARLARDEDPEWLVGDIVGALTVLTGKRFGYDRESWLEWWRAASADWQPEAPSTE